MNVWIWGPAMWDLLHAAAFLSDIRGLDIDGLVAPLKTLLPCKYCRESFVNFYAALGRPKRSSKNDPHAAAKWIYEVHKLVNTKLAKQRTESFLKKHTITDPNALNALTYSFEDLFASPSFEVVQKRFMVQRDEPIQWRSYSTALLAIVMGLELLSPDVADKPKYADLARFLMTVKALLQKCSKQSNEGPLVYITNELLAMVHSQQGPKLLRAKLESYKYANVVSNGCVATPTELSSLIKAGQCISGTCS